MKKKLSIIVPVYRAQDYILDCVKTIYQQNLSDSDFELILVNDGTPDDSIGVVADFISQHNNVIVIDQKNMGVSIARNTGLAKAIGEYVYFMDPDDMLVTNSLSTLLSKAIESSVDILMADYRKFEEGFFSPDLLNENQTYNEQKKSSADAFLNDLSPYECYIWRLLIKRDLLISKHIDFKPFWYEDTLFCQECFLKADNCLRVDFVLYVYRTHQGSFTSSMNVKKLKDLNSSLSALINLKHLDGLSMACKRHLKDNIFISFNYGIWCITHNKMIYNQRKEIISDMRNKIKPKDLMFDNGLKQFVVSIMFRFFPYLYLMVRFKIA